MLLGVKIALENPIGIGRGYIKRLMGTACIHRTANLHLPCHIRSEIYVYRDLRAAHTI